jgi:hypothetical protein
VTTDRRKGETKLQAAIVDAIELRFPRAKVRRLNSGSARVKRGYLHLCPKGTPDLEVLLPGGRSVHLETKLGDGEASAEQLAWANWANNNGHAHAFVWNVDDALAAVGAWVKKGAANG